MHRAFVFACAKFSPSFPNWNAEFQLAWEMEDNTLSQAKARMEALRRVEDAFLAEAAHTVKQIVTLDDDGPRELPKFLHCYRVHNIFFRVLPDSRSGRNYVASLRGVLQSRTRLLTVPLSCMLFYRGMPVLAQALIPMPQHPTGLYGADSINNREVEAEVLHMAEALGISPPEQLICDVYAGLDMRLYCISTNVTTCCISDGALRRQDMPFMCALMKKRAGDIFDVLHSSFFLDALSKLKKPARGIVPAHLCETLHLHGVNLCLLKQVFRSLVVHRPSHAKALGECIAIEMITRSMKHVFCLRVQATRMARDDARLQSCVLHCVGSGLDDYSFEEDFLPVLMRKYKLSPEDSDIIDLIKATRISRRRDIIARFLTHIGVRLHTHAASSVEKIVWLLTVQSRVVPLMVDAQVLVELAAQFKVSTTMKGHVCGLCLPLQVKVAHWKGRLERAIRCARWVAAAKKTRHGQLSLPYLYAMRDVCRLLFSGRTVKLIKEGRRVLEDIIEGFCATSGHLSQMRLYLEAGCWLLGSSGIVEMGEEALQHFKMAVRLAPAELRSDCGVWLYIQPFLGLLRCKQALRPKLSVNVVNVARDATELASILTPTDYYVQYLWELGMELRLDGEYEVASTTLFAAVSMCKKAPRTELDLSALMQDLINVYRAWNPKKYSTYCDFLLATLGDTRSDLPPFPPNELCSGNSP